MESSPFCSKALLIIDMQNALFYGSENPFNSAEVLANINQLIAKARAAGAPVFAARHTGPAGSPFDPDNPITHLIEELQVEPNSDEVFIKRFPNCFRDTGLHQKLKARDINELVIVGMKTQFCVDTTCRAAADAGYSVVLIADAHTTTDSKVIPAEAIIAHHNDTLSGPFVKTCLTKTYIF